MPILPSGKARYCLLFLLTSAILLTPPPVQAQTSPNPSQPLNPFQSLRSRLTPPLFQTLTNTAQGIVLSLQSSLASSLLRPQNSPTHHIKTTKQIKTTTKLTKGVYQLQVTPPKNWDAIFQTHLTVTTSEKASHKIYIGVNPGKGRAIPTSLSRPNQSPSLINKLKTLATNSPPPQVLGITTEQDIPSSAQQQMEIVTFEDYNYNGRKEVYEPQVVVPNLDINLYKSDNQIIYPLLNGWNLVHFPLQPSTFSTASEMVAEVAREGGFITSVATWQNGRWLTYTQRGNQAYSQDFPIEPGRAYFLRSHQQVDWLVTGAPITNPTTLTLEPGWNSVGLFYPDYNAQHVLNQLNQTAGLEQRTDLPQVSQGDAPGLEAAPEIDRWLSGSWQVFVKRIYSQDNIRQYGDSFTIQPQDGYMIRSNDYIKLPYQSN